MKAPNGFGGITHLKGNRRKPYWVRVTVGWEVSKTGKQKQIYKTLGYFEKRKDAMLALAEYNTKPYDLVNVDMTFADCYAKWSPRHFEEYPKSERVYRTFYKRCSPIHKMKMKDIRTAHLQAIVDDMKGMSEQSQFKVKTIFNSTFKWALENDIIQKDYSSFVKIHSKKSEKTTKHFAREEIKKVFDNLDFTVEYPIKRMQYVTMNLSDTLPILFYTGVRINELLHIKWEDIKLKERIIYVHGTKTVNADRIVPIHKELVPFLEARKGGTYLIEDVQGKPVPYHAYMKYFFGHFMEHLGLEHTPHATRHTFVSRMDASGVSAQSVVLKRIAGHSNKDTTENYTHKEIEELIEAIDKLKLL